MITTHPTVNHARLATFKSTKSMLGLRNKTLPNTIIPQHNGITFHGGMANIIPQFFTIVNDGVLRVHVMVTYPNRFVPMTTIGYPISVKNDDFFAIPNENGYLYNRVRTELIETLKGNHYNAF
jgi:hypothetical protein